MSLLEYEQTLKSKIQLIAFMSLIRQQNEGDYLLYSKKFVDYKNRLLMVSDKIDKWHIQLKEQNKKPFINDNEFLETINSPNEFFESSGESCSSSNEYDQKDYFDMPIRDGDFMTSMSFENRPKNSKADGAGAGGHTTSKYRSSKTKNLDSDYKTHGGRKGKGRAVMDGGEWLNAEGNDCQVLADGNNYKLAKST